MDTEDQLLAIEPPKNKDIKFSEHEDLTPDEQSIMMADHQRNLVY